MTGLNADDAPQLTVTNSLSETTGSVLQVGSIKGNVLFKHEMNNVPEVPRQVPAALESFVDRVDKSSDLEAALGVEGSRSARIAVLNGLPGVGKSAMVRHWAAQAIDRYPGGQLYVDFAVLRTEAGAAIGDALADCLRALGVRQEQIPDRLSARASLFRSKTAERPVLVVLDDVTEPAQVRSLVPNSGGSAVLATSNERLVELALDGAQLLTLNPMDDAEGLAVLERVCGSGRLDREEEDARRLVSLCGGLPVALQVVAARLISRPRLSVRALADELADETRRLERLSLGGNRVVSAVFNNAYASLPDDAAELYRRLGAIPGHSFSVDVAVTAGGLERQQTMRLLDTFIDARLINETLNDRFRFHDLIRLHAREQYEIHMARLESCRPVDEVAYGLMSYYLRMAAFADRAIMGERTRIADHQNFTEDHVDPFTGPDRSATALNWLSTERSNMLALLHAVSNYGWHDQVWQLVEAMVPMFLSRRYFDDWLEAADLGISAARQADNPAAEARLRSIVSRAYTDLGRLDQAQAHLDEALPLSRRSGNAILVASVWEFIGRAREARDDLEGAIAAYREAEARNNEAGERRGAALARYFIGRTLDASGDHTRAVGVLSRAREELQELGDQRMAARGTISLGLAYSHVGDHENARAELMRAVSVFAESEAWYYEAQAREALAEVLDHLGDGQGARQHRARVRELRGPSPSE